MNKNFRKTDFVPVLAPAQNAGRKVVIAVDGPAASGKGTLSRKLAERLGYAWLDTGALYRAVGLAVLEMSGDPANAEDAAAAVGIVKRNLTPELLSSRALRTQAVASAASKVGAIPGVRVELLDFQREFALNPPGDVGGAVIDGRDIGSVVCPDADVKIFVTAHVNERARRRFAEVQATGATYEEILEDLVARDERDSQRAVAPMLPASDAYVIDTSTLNAGEVLEEAINLIRARFVEETSGSAAV
jgi:CMP/dCMP kinase